ASLFRAFCASLVDRYFLHDLVERGHVTSIEPLRAGSDDPLFAVSFWHDGREVTVHARHVVAAVGNTNIPAVPAWVAGAVEGEDEAKGRIVHAAELMAKGAVAVPRVLEERMGSGRAPTRLLVVGGGLTSAQLTDLGVRRGFDEVVLISRSKLRTMPFDLSLDWVGRNSMIHHADFWAEKDPKARRQLLVKAKNGGGSITPEHMAVLRGHVAAGKVRILEKTTVASIEWRAFPDDPRDGRWEVAFDRPDAAAGAFDLIWLGTGAVLDVKREAWLAKVVERYPVEVVGGLPVLGKDLQWPGLELYLMSGYSALTIGPSAGNLFGARVAAQRIASALWERWQAELEKPVAGDGECRCKDPSRAPIAACLIDEFCPWHPDEKHAAFSGASAAAASKKLHSSILFPELAKEINSEPQSTANLKGLFIVTVLKKGEAVDEW
ncbi:hypothetical protein HDU96_003447, partial [Phlyctochytrium bullatum]